MPVAGSREGRTLVVVVGCQRSGTTLVGQILGAHPEAVLLDEEDGLYDWIFAELGKPDLVKQPVEWPQLCERARRKYARPGERFSSDGMLSEDVRYLVLKAPNLTYSWAEIAHHFPDSRVVYLYRDPRAIVASMKRLPVPFVANQSRLIRAHPEALEAHRQVVESWTDDDIPMHLKMADVAGIKMSFASRFEAAGLAVSRVRYGELVEEPGRSTDSLLGSLDLGFDEALGLEHQSCYVGTGPGGTDRTRAVDTRSHGAWRQELTDVEADEILRRTVAITGAPCWSADTDDNTPIPPGGGMGASR